MQAGLSQHQIMQLFEDLNTELQKDAIRGEIYLVGGAVMCLVYNARGSTQDVDAYFEPGQKIRTAAARVGINRGIDEHWLNDGVKGYLGDNKAFTSFLELSHLKLLVAQPEYLLAMKCLSMRIGEEFQDINDIRYLLRYLNLSDYNEALTVILEYYPLERFPQKTLYALEEICQRQSAYP